MSDFAVSTITDWLGHLVSEHPKFWAALGNLETKLLLLEKTPITSPIYICGLARSGSTILLEMLASLPNVATHRYSDFPFLFTPYIWNTLLKINPARDKTLRERAHGDNILVNADSPEAMEEVLWQARVPDVFYQDHIRKLLRVRGATRYVCKNNYNITRMEHLLRLFPDARFIIPVREPVAHVESLMRQHARFCEAGARDPRVVRHMDYVGHREFGLGRRAIDVGDTARLVEINTAWEKGEEVRGWALYWNMVYHYIAGRLEQNPALKAQTLIVHYEALCQQPHETLRAIAAHIGVAENAFSNWEKKLHMPDYYQTALNGDEINLIQSISTKIAKSLGA